MPARKLRGWSWRSSSSSITFGGITKGSGTSCQPEFTSVDGREFTSGGKSENKPSWIAKDGKSFWLVWTDGQQRGEMGELLQTEEEAKSKGSISQDYMRRVLLLMRRMSPYYSFNTQRVELVIA